MDNSANKEENLKKNVKYRKSIKCKTIYVKP